MTTNLHRLHVEEGQSPWLDNLTRELVTGGGLAELIAGGIRGVTANPTILANAITGSSSYDDQLHRLVRGGSTVEEAYWALVIDDVVAALDLLRPIYDESRGADGSVSLELAPSLAHDAYASVQAARALTDRINRPNLLVKIPATTEGVRAIRAATAAGLNINATLIFSVGRYGQVLEAFVAGLEDLIVRGGDPSTIHSVASLFISRVDSEVRRRLPEREWEATVCPTAGVAQAKLAYDMFTWTTAGDRWGRLARMGARPQRPLWASTSTKDPSLPDTYYVDELIGSATVTTLTESTIRAFGARGTVARTVDVGLEGAEDAITRIEAAGIDLVDVGLTLEYQGVAAFDIAFEQVIETLRKRARGEPEGDAHAA